VGVAEQVVYIHTATGEPRREWCDRCLTSARLVVDVYALMDSGPQPLGAFGGCTRCDPDLFD